MYITIYMLNRCTDFNEIRLGDTLIFEDMSYSDNWYTWWWNREQKLVYRKKPPSKEQMVMFIITLFILSGHLVWDQLKQTSS